MPVYSLKIFENFILQATMNYVPTWLRLPRISNGMENKPSKTSEEPLSNDNEKADSSEHQLSVSSTEKNLFEGQDRISVSDVPSDQRKKNSFYRWFKRKLWCIKRSKSAESNRVRNPARKNAKAEIKQSATEKPKETKLPSTKVPLAEVDQNDPYEPEVAVIRPTTAKTPNESVQDAPVTPQAAALKERQVTFSDTVKTHIKTKYVTAEELQQIRGMNLNNRRILYQYNQNPDVKGGDVSENSNIVLPIIKTEPRRVRQSSENKVT